MLSVCEAHSSDKALDELLVTLNKRSQVGMIVRDLTTGKTRYEFNADQTFVPASNTKLITAYTALKKLGPAFQYHTTLLENAHGDISIHFTGDPTLTSTDLDALLSHLSGTKKRLYIDDKRFARKHYGHGWMWDELNFCYAAPTSALILDKNCFLRIIQPTSPGKTSKLNRLLHTTFTPILNDVQTASNNKKCHLELTVDNDNHYHLTGCINSTMGQRELNLAIHNPRAYAKATIQSLLTKHHITLEKGIVFGALKGRSHIIAIHHSPRLQALVHLMLKHSDNLIADSLFLSMSKKDHQPASWHHSAKVMTEFISTKLGIKPEHIELYDGSGLSRYNRVTPTQLVQVLSAIYHDDTLKPIILQALPIAGMDGSLEKRYRTSSLKTHLIAKTGTMKHIDNLSGYLLIPSKHPIVFSLMINGLLEKTATMHLIEERLLNALSKR